MRERILQRRESEAIFQFSKFLITRSNVHLLLVSRYIWPQREMKYINERDNLFSYTKLSLTDNAY